jgi:hypothetical protein
MTVERHIDDDPLATGTNAGATGFIIYDDSADFKSCGVAVGLAVHNETAGTDGLVTAVTEGSVTFDISIASGDVWQIFKTGERGSSISKVYTDRIYGTKAVKPSDLNARGRFHEDEDKDADRENVWGGYPDDHGKTY